MFSLFYVFVMFCALGCRHQAGSQADDGKRYICRAVPLVGDTSCPVTLLPEIINNGGQEEELRNTVMQLRDTILQQKETISKQLGTINELTTKLSLCASTTDDRKYEKGGPWGKVKQNTMGDVPRDPNDTVENLGKTMQGLKDRLENLEVCLSHCPQCMRKWPSFVLINLFRTHTVSNSVQYVILGSTLCVRLDEMSHKLRR